MDGEQEEKDLTGAHVQVGDPGSVFSNVLVLPASCLNRSIDLALIYRSFWCMYCMAVQVKYKNIAFNSSFFPASSHR